MNYLSTKTIQSQAEECSGVSFTIKRISVHRSHAVEDIKEPFNAKLRPLREEFQPLHEARKQALESKSELPAEKLSRWAELLNQMTRIDREEMTPAVLRYCLVKIEGLDIDGQPATLDLIRENGPDALYNEIATAVARELGLLPEEVDELKLPSTSAAVVDGNPTTISAAPAGKQETTSPAAA